MLTDPVDHFDPVRREVAASISIVAGELRRGCTSVYSVMRNERFLLPAYLDHYRSLGAAQFLILSDRSDDGTDEYLRDQDDCVLLRSPHAYGDWLDMPAGSAVRRRRAGVLMKGIIPRIYLHGQVAIYADADEFLVLPPGLASITDLVTTMAHEGSTAVYASMVEMYPERLSALEDVTITPESLDQLLAISPYFDACALVKLDLGAEVPTIVGSSASTRLFRRFAVGQRRRVFDMLPLPARRLVTTRTFSSAVYKTPVVDFQDGVDLADSHRAAGASYSRMLLGLLHFKFTPDSLRKVPRIIAEKSHSRQSRKYVGYELLFDEMRRSEGSFLGPDSRRYEGAESLAAVGLSSA